MHVNNAHALRLFENRQFSRVSCKEKKGAARRLAWVDCSAAQSWRCIRRQSLVSTFRGSTFAARKALCAMVRKRWLQNCHPWMMLQFLYDCHCRRTSVCLYMSNLRAENFLQCSGNSCIGKDPTDGACLNPCIRRICRAWPPVACRGRMGRKLLSALLCILHFVSCISWRPYFCIRCTLFHSVQCNLFNWWLWWWGSYNVEQIPTVRLLIQVICLLWALPPIFI